MTPIKFALIFCLGLLFSGCVQQPEPQSIEEMLILSPQGKTQVCQVLNVYDGDTFACDLNGNGRIDKPVEYIRLLGIDTPETRHSKKFKNDPTKAGKDQPYAQEASRYLRHRLEHQEVTLEFDTQRRDRYKRTLAYVFLDDGCINLELLRRGLATVLFYPPNTQWEQPFLLAEHLAQQEQLGLWDKPDY